MLNDNLHDAISMLAQWQQVALTLGKTVEYGVFRRLSHSPLDKKACSNCSGLHAFLLPT